MTKTNFYKDNTYFECDEDEKAYIKMEDIGNTIEFILNQSENIVFTDITIKPQRHKIKKVKRKELADSTVTNGVSLKRGNARNEGTIEVKDVQNSLGAYVNVNSSITSSGKININSTIAGLTDAEKAANKKQAYNMGMRADTVSGAEIINNGEITIDGAYLKNVRASYCRHFALLINA